jgi:hypothetical protein
MICHATLPLSAPVRLAHAFAGIARQMLPDTPTRTLRAFHDIAGGIIATVHATISGTQSAGR